MNSFFDNLLKASTPAATTTPRTKSPQPPSLDGAAAGQTLLNLLQQGQHPTPATQPPSSPEPAITPDSAESEAMRLLKATMYNSNARLLGRSDSSSSAAQIRDMLEATDLEDSPSRKSFGAILRGACNSFEWDSETPMGTPSGLTQICKLKNLASPDQVRRLISFDAKDQVLVYAIQAQPRSSDQGGKMRVINQARGTRTLLSGHSAPIVDVLICPWDSTLVLSLSSSGLAALYRIIEDFAKKSSDQDDPAGAMTSKMICSIKSGKEPFKSIAWHPSIPVIAIARGSSIEIWDLSDVVSSDESEEPVEELIPPVFTNTPADPRLSLLQEHHEAVNTVCFSPDGSQICSGADDGAVCIWNWNQSEDMLARKFTPDDDRPVNVVHWARAPGFSSPSSDRLIYMQCDAHRNVQIWDVQGDSPCARLDLPPGKNKNSLQNMIVDNTGSFIIVPFNGDETFGLIVVHVLRRSLPNKDSSVSEGSDDSEGDLPNEIPELDPLGCRFDFLLPFNIQHLVISAAAIAPDEASPSAFQLYTVQKHAVQIFHFTDLQYSSLSPVDSSMSRAVPFVAPAVSIADDDLDRPISQSREPPIPISTMSPMGESTHRPSFAVNKILNRSASSHSSPTAATPSAVLSRSQSGNALSSRHSFASDKITSIAKPSSQNSPLRRESSSLTEAELKRLMTEHIDLLRQEIAAERKARDKEEIRRTKQLLESVSKTINVVIPERVDQAVNQAVASAIENSVLPRLETMVSNVVQHHIKELPFVLRTPIMDSFRESFKDQLLPAFRGSFTTMFQQINSTLETGLRQQSEEHMGHLIPSKTFEIVVDLLKNIDMKLSQQQVDRSRHAPAMDHKKEIAALAQQEHFNEAFTKALNAGDANLVVWLCGLLTTQALHHRGPHECSPPVLLSLAQQISFHLTESETTSVSMQLDWLREALMALSTRPRSEQIAAHVPAVLSQIQNNIEHRMNDFDSQQQTTVRMIMFVLATLLK